MQRWKQELTGIEFRWTSRVLDTFTYPYVSVAGYSLDVWFMFSTTHRPKAWP